MKLPNLQRHWFTLWINAFFFSFLFSSIDGIPNIPLILDHTQHHQFYTSPYLPNIQNDYYNNALKFDGSLPVALSSYHFFNNPFLNIEDTNKINNSFFSYRQGDYLYRDLIVNKTVMFNDSLKFDFVGQTKIFPGPYNNLGPQFVNSNNSLQNYQIAIEKYYSADFKFFIDYFYHKENIGLPIYYDNNSQLHESNNVSFYGEKIIENYLFNTRLALQNGNLFINNYNIDYLTIWSDASIYRKINDNLNLKFNFEGKLSNYEVKNFSNSRNFKNDLSIGFDYKKNKLLLDFGIKSLNENVYGYFNYSYFFKDLKFKAYYQPMQFFNMQSPFKDTLSYSSKLLTFKGFSFDYVKEIFSIKNKFVLNFINYKIISNFNYLFTSYELDNQKFSLKLNSFNSIKNKSKQDYYNIKLQIVPVISWIGFEYLKNIPLLGIIIWNSEKRYKPFFNIECTFIDWVQSGFSEIGKYELNQLPNSQFYWSFGFGFDVHNFRFSWTHNYLSSEFISFSDYQENITPIHPVGAISFFQIDWRFYD